MHRQVRFLRLWISLSILPLGLIVTGCGASKGTVSGKVSYKGEPVRGGTVMIVPQTGSPVRGDIQEDGSYKILNVPLGPAKVAVETESVKPASPAGPPQAMGAAAYYAKMPKEPPPGAPGGGDASKYVAGTRQGDKNRYVAIPAQYSDAERSGLTLTVKSGKNSFDIDLK